MEEHLRKLFYTPGSPGFFAGINQLHQLVKKEYPRASQKSIEQWLLAQDTYRRHRIVRKPPKHVPIVGYFRDDLWQIDLLDCRNVATKNRNYKFILVAVDVVSRYLFAEGLKKKSSQHVADALLRIFQRSGRRPSRIFSDPGTEFQGPPFRKLLKEFDIKQKLGIARYKARLAERYIRTLREKISRWVTYTGKANFIDNLQEIVDSINKSYHRIIKMPPSEVNAENEPIVIDRLYGKLRNTPLPTKFKYKIGQSVNKAKLKGIMSKGSAPTFTKGVHKIVDIIKRPPIELYVLEKAGEVIKPNFYRTDLVAVNPPMNQQAPQNGIN